MDEKSHFLLKLKGKTNGGHLHHWSDVEGEIVGLQGPSDTYVLVARVWGCEIFEDYVVSDTEYYTLGEKCKHNKLVEIIQGKAPKEPLVLAHRYE